MNHTVLVTGACGQLGRELRLLSANYPEDRFIFTDVIEAEGLDTLILDMTDRLAVDAVVTSRKVDVIINCAAYTNVDAAEDNPDLAYKLNAEAVAGLAAVARSHDALLIQVSTDYVFGGESFDSPIPETAKPSPLGVYGHTKYAGEQEVIASGCSYVIVRTAWLYSEFCKNFMKTMLSLFSIKSSVTVVSDQRGTPTYARDLAAALLKIMQSPVKGIFHYTDEGECTWFEFASEIAEISGTACQVRSCTSDEYPSKTHRPTYSVLDKSKIKKTFGLDIPLWQESLKVCMNNYQKQNNQ